MSLFKRLFRVSQAEAHAIVDKFEDPIKMTEQGIRDLKKVAGTHEAASLQPEGLEMRVITHPWTGLSVWRPDRERPLSWSLRAWIGSWCETIVAAPPGY